MTITYQPSECLHQFYKKEHLDIDNELTQDQWEEFVSNSQDTFVQQAEEAAKDLFYEFCEGLNK